MHSNIGKKIEKRSYLFIHYIGKITLKQAFNHCVIHLFIPSILQLLHKENDASSKPVDAACRQIVDCLVMNVLKLEQKAVEVSEGKVCYKLTLFTTLFLQSV